MPTLATLIKQHPEAVSAVGARVAQQMSATRIAGTPEQATAAFRRASITGREEFPP